MLKQLLIHCLFSSEKQTVLRRFTLLKNFPSAWSTIQWSLCSIQPSQQANQSLNLSVDTLVIYTLFCFAMINKE